MCFSGYDIVPYNSFPYKTSHSVLHPLVHPSVVPDGILLGILLLALLAATSLDLVHVVTDLVEGSGDGVKNTT